MEIGECMNALSFPHHFFLSNILFCKLEYVLLLQNDIDVACGVADSDFEPVLKPYQLVGVNFLLLLHRKGIGGGTCPNLLTPMFCSVWTLYL